MLFIIIYLAALRLALLVCALFTSYFHSFVVYLTTLSVASVHASSVIGTLPWFGVWPTN
jgi:hypothetical protein